MAQSVILIVSRLKIKIVGWITIIRLCTPLYVQFPFNSDTTACLLMNGLFLSIESLLKHHSDFCFSYQHLYLLTRLDLVIRHIWCWHRKTVYQIETNFELYFMLQLKVNKVGFKNHLAFALNGLCDWKQKALEELRKLIHN